ncbi:MerR family transcriptional regulator [Cytobacillus sp. Sa5YUA1]|uniref:MerR family transcriptional regulator n=1 Tax=Cytobacillus stercorigallinarum TaxID=2762240 RepID=A0ABR8QW79_9BACI|nr:MerR family transcriptional regulator [Cytobacillus stercorigallinarum]
MRIGQVAKLSGLTSRTIDYYTKKNLLSVERSSSNYRLYPEDVLNTLERIKALKKERLSILEIQRVLHTQDNQGVDPMVIEVQEEINRLKGKLEIVEQRYQQCSEIEKKRVFRILEKELSDCFKRLNKC